MYLQQSFDSVSYYEGDVYNRPFAYIPEDDAVWYDPSNDTFWDYSFLEANTHELAHRIGNFFARSSDSEDFYVAIQNAKEIVNSNPQFFVDYCWVSRDNFISDIIDALSEGSLDLPVGHGGRVLDGDEWKYSYEKGNFC